MKTGDRVRITQTFGPDKVTRTYEGVVQVVSVPYLYQPERDVWLDGFPDKIYVSDESEVEILEEASREVIWGELVTGEVLLNLGVTNERLLLEADGSEIYTWERDYPDLLTPVFAMDERTISIHEEFVVKWSGL